MERLTPSAASATSELALAHLRNTIRHRFDEAPRQESAPGFPRSFTFTLLTQYPAAGLAAAGVVLVVIGPLRTIRWALQLVTAWKLVRSMIR